MTCPFLLVNLLAALFPFITKGLLISTPHELGHERHCPATPPDPRIRSDGS